MDPLHLISQTTPPVPDTAWFDGTAQLITAITGLLGAALAWFKHYLPKRRKRQVDASFVDGLQEVGQMYELMDEILNIPTDRCIVFAAHNSGGVPRIGSPFYTSAVNWRAKRLHKIPLGDYKEMAVDGVYVNMLVRLRETGELLFVTGDNPNCYLGDIYRSEGISESVLFYLGIRENKFLYLSVAVYGRSFTVDQRTTLRMRAQQIRHLVLKTVH